MSKLEIVVVEIVERYVFYCPECGQFNELDDEPSYIIDDDDNNVNPVVCENCGAEFRASH